MIVLWCESDFDKTIEVKDWLDEHISYIEHRRDSIPSHVKTIVRAYGNTYTGKLSYTPVYNHYVPYSRISKALIDLMEQNTRRNLIARLKELRSAFQVDDPFFTSAKVLSNIDHSDIKKIVPEDSKFAFHSWVNHVFQEICDWPHNIFVGPSIGDSQGRRIDAPLDHSPNLSMRLYHAVQSFHDKFPEMKLDDCFGSLDSYKAGHTAQDLQELQNIEKKLKSENPKKEPRLEEHSDVIDEYVSESEDEDQRPNQPHYVIVEKKRLRGLKEKVHRKGMLNK